MKEYDIVFSMGYACAVSEALRDLGFQRESYPLDWVGAPSVLAGPRMIADDFADWFRREDLKLWDVRFVGGHVSRVYKNVHTGFGFPHEFTNAAPFEVAYEGVKAKYDRRIRRFHEKMLQSRRALAIYLELPTRPRPPDGDLCEARRVLSMKYPDCEVDLLCFYEDDSCVAAEQAAHFDGISVVKCHYRTMIGDKVHHVADRRQLTEYLRNAAAVPHPVTEEESAAFRAVKRREYYASLGRNFAERWLYKKMTQWHRDLEAYLIGEKLLPGDHPTWFAGSGK